MDTLTHLCTLYKTLSSTDQQTLVKFAEFLQHSSTPTAEHNEILDSTDTKDAEIETVKKIVVKPSVSNSNIPIEEEIDSLPLSPSAQLKEASQPTLIPRGENETIVGAIRRLSASYPMLEKSKLLHEANALMTEHIMQGRDVDAVIDELEALFAKHYEKYRTTQGT